MIAHIPSPPAFHCKAAPKTLLSEGNIVPLPIFFLNLGPSKLANGLSASPSSDLARVMGGILRGKGLGMHHVSIPIAKQHTA